MKIPSSSSFILAATLAVSSSTPTLAAPAGEASEGGMTSSSSNQLISSRSGNVDGRALNQAEVVNHQSRSEELDERGLLEDTLCAITKLLGSSCTSGPPQAGAESMNFDAEAFASAIDAMSTTTANSTGAAVTGPPASAPTVDPTTPGTTGSNGNDGPDSSRDNRRRDATPVDPMPSSQATQTTNSLYPSATPVNSNTPNNTPNIAAVDPPAGGAPAPPAPPTLPGPLEGPPGTVIGIIGSTPIGGAIGSTPVGGAVGSTPLGGVLSFNAADASQAPVAAPAPPAPVPAAPKPPVPAPAPAPATGAPPVPNSG